MGKPHLLDIGYEFMRYVGIRQIVISVFASPGTDVNFVNRIRLRLSCNTLASLHPLMIFPIVFRFPHNRCSLRWCFCIRCKWICLLYIFARIGMNCVLVRFAMADTGKESFPDSGTVPAGMQMIMPRLPVVEIPYYRNRGSVGCPDSEVCSLLVSKGHRMCSELLIQLVVFATSEKMDIIV